MNNKMEEQEFEGCNSYIITQLRYMCEVVLKKTKKYEHLLKSNGNVESEDLGKKLIDLISLVEKNCQAFKESWKHFHQTDSATMKVLADSENNEVARDPTSSMDFYRPLSQIYRNEMFKNESFDIFGNNIKQESKETEEASVLADNTEENSNSSTNIWGSSEANTEVQCDEESDDRLSPILGRKIIAKEKTGNINDQKNGVIENKHGKAKQEWNNDELLKQLSEVIDSPSLYSSYTIKSDKEIDDSYQEIGLSDKQKVNPTPSSILSSTSTSECSTNHDYADENETSDQNVNVSAPMLVTSSTIKPTNENNEENNISNESDVFVTTSPVPQTTSTIKLNNDDNKSGRENKISKRKEIINKSPISLCVPLATTGKIGDKNRKSIDHEYSTSLPTTSSNENNSDNNEVTDCNPPTFSTSSIAKSDSEKDESDFEEGIPEDNYKLTDSQETEIYSQDLICDDDLRTPAQENNECLTNLFEEVRLQDTRDDLFELLPPYSQSVLNDETNITNGNMHNSTKLDDQNASHECGGNSDSRPKPIEPISIDANTTRASINLDIANNTDKNSEDVSLHLESKLSQPSSINIDSIKAISHTQNSTGEDVPSNLISFEDNTRDDLLHLLPPLSQPILIDTRSTSDSTNVQSYTEQEVEHTLKQLDLCSDCSQIGHSDDTSDDEDSVETGSLPGSTSIESFEEDGTPIAISDSDHLDIEDEDSLAETSSIEDLGSPIDPSDLIEFYKDEFNLKDCYVLLRKIENMENQIKIPSKIVEDNQENTDEGVELSGGDNKSSPWSSYCSDDNLSDNDDFEERNSLSDSMSENNIENDCPFPSDDPGNEIKTSRDINSTGDIHEDDEINRLCQIDTIQRKRLNSEEEIGRKRKKEKEDASEASETQEISADQILEDCIENSNIRSELETIDGDQYLAAIVSNTIKDFDETYESDVETTKEIDKEENRDLQHSKIRKVYDRSTHEKDNWSRDPLLTCKITLDSEDESGKSKKKRETVKRKTDIVQYKNILEDERDDRIYNNDEISSSDEDMEHEVKKNKEGSKSNIVETTELETPTDTELQSVQSAEQEQSKSCDATKKNCRKNIRAVLTYEELTEATKRAEKEEEQRSVRIEQRQQQYNSSQLTDEDEFVLDTTKEGEKIKVDPQLCKRLYPHQRDGVMFMWQSCYESVERLQKFRGVGCILAHCMGLGKTFQVFTLLHTLFSHPITNMKRCLIICPVSTIIPWAKEIKSGLELAREKIDIIVEYIEGADNVITKCLKIKKWQEHSGILLMGYEAFVHLIFGKSVCNQIEVELYGALLDPGPDLVVCDEGHLLKNGKAKRTQAVSKIKTRRRIILSGTPMQNNLKEYYYMVNFVNPNLLGTFKEYDNRFVLPITNGQYGDSTQMDIMLMKKRSHVLHKLLRNTVQRFEVSELNKYLEPIKNFTIFMQLHPVQASLYKYFIQQAKQHFTLSSSKSTNLFGDMNVAKYICSHPHLLSIMEKELKKNSKDLLLNGEENVLKVEFMKKDWWKALCSESDLQNIDCGPKLKLTLAIIEEAEKLGEKVLIFTSSLIELNTLQYFLKKVGTSHCKSWIHKKDYFRMDGSVPPSKRAKMCFQFNNPANKRFRLLFISYKVGGLGLTLIAANRVIILGSVFNPVHDTQSIYRCYRFGQTKTVYVYRLISMGTMEEKIYRRCVSKLALACRVVDKQQIDRHYDLSEIKQLYADDINLNMPKLSLSKPDDDLLATLILKFDFLHNYVDHQGLLENKPEDDLNDEDKKKAWEEFSRECETQNTVGQLKQHAPTLEAMLATSVGPTLNDILRNLVTNLETPMNAGPSNLNNLTNINVQAIRKNVPSSLELQKVSSHRRADSFLPTFSQFIHPQEHGPHIGSHGSETQQDITKVKNIQSQNESILPLTKQQMFDDKRTYLKSKNTATEKLGDSTINISGAKTVHKNEEHFSLQGSSQVAARRNYVAGSLSESSRTEVQNLINKNDVIHSTAVQEFDMKQKKAAVTLRNLQMKPPLLSKLKQVRLTNLSNNEKKILEIMESNKDLSITSNSKIGRTELPSNVKTIDTIKKKITAEVNEQIENLSDITVEAIIPRKILSKPKQTDSLNLKIFHNKHTIAGTSSGNLNESTSKKNSVYTSTPNTSISQAVSVHGRPPNENSSFNLGSNKLAVGLKSASVMKMTSGQSDSVVIHRVSPNHAPSGVIHVPRVDISQNKRTIIQNSNLSGNSHDICDSNANSCPKMLLTIPKIVATQRADSKNILKQMHKLNKPQMLNPNLVTSSRAYSHLKRLSAQKKFSDATNNIENKVQRSSPQVPVQNISRATNLSETHNSYQEKSTTNTQFTSHKGSKRVYPFSSADQLECDSQQSPLDLTKKIKQNESIRMTDYVISNDQVKKKINLVDSKHTKKKMKPVPINMQRSIESYKAINVLGKRTKKKTTIASTSADSKYEAISSGQLP